MDERDDYREHESGQRMFPRIWVIALFGVVAAIVVGAVIFLSAWYAYDEYPVRPPRSAPATTTSRTAT
jgi:hypothetical protein